MMFNNIFRGAFCKYLSACIAALGAKIDYPCGGNCACTTCAVVIKSGADNLTEMDDAELDRLDTAWDVGPDSRLACQAVVRGDVVCEVPRYTRNYVREGTA